jgi:tRNA threonylcarbamoyladenosine biosynthesis protein TsaB
LKILGIDTSGELFSLCLLEDGRVLYEITKDRTAVPGVRDARFFAEAQRVVQDLGPEKPDAVAVGLGPGMFTSLRIGLSLTKALALAWRLPVVAVNTLDTIGAALSFYPEPVLAVINAYQGEIYAALYDHGRRRGGYLVAPPRALAKKFPVRLLVVGPGVAVLKKSRRPAAKHWTYIADDRFWPSARRIARLAEPRIRRGDFDDPDRLEPYYIKRTDAERNRG